MAIVIRVYGVLINENNEILLSDEHYAGQFFTKFPGGGLEYGEGTKDCLIREFEEELNLEITVGELIYLTDFFQPSAFNQEDQIISVYYRVFAENLKEIKTSKKAFEQLGNQKEMPRWKSMDKLRKEDVTFPIDKLVVEKIRKR